MFSQLVRVRSTGKGCGIELSEKLSARWDRLDDVDHDAGRVPRHEVPLSPGLVTQFKKNRQTFLAHLVKHAINVCDFEGNQET